MYHVPVLLDELLWLSLSQMLLLSQVQRREKACVSHQPSLQKTGGANDHVILQRARTHTYTYTYVHVHCAHAQIGLLYARVRKRIFRDCFATRVALPRFGMNLKIKASWTRPRALLNLQDVSIFAIFISAKLARAGEDLVYANSFQHWFSTTRE